MTKGSSSQAFYSLPEFQEWKDETENWAKWTVKYYKGDDRNVRLKVFLTLSSRFGNIQELRGERVFC